MSDPLYRLDLLRLAADARGAGRLSAPHATGQAYNPACGDRVIADLAFVDECVAEFAHETKACVLTQASASILGGVLRGITRGTLEKLRRDVMAMLDSKQQMLPGPFERYSVFAGAIEYPNRHRCVLLPIEAVLDAFAQRAKNESDS